MERKLGYRQDAEDYASLAATARPLVFTASYKAPKAISHRAWRRVKDQGQVGRCTGASRASAEEVLNWISTGGDIKTFSMDYAYVQNQIASGLFGQGDVGATIDGSMKASRTTGIILEDDMPQSPGYVTQLPVGAEATGKLHLIKSHAIMNSYDDVFQFIASGVGVVLIGIPWTVGMTNLQESMEPGQGGGRILGGHALYFNGFSGTRVDEDSRPYIDMENSHGRDWADAGFCLIAPRVIDKWIDGGNAFIGISDLESFGPRAVATFEGIFS